MTPAGASHIRTDRMLDALSTRAGILLSIGLLVLMCVGVAVYLQSVVWQMELSSEDLDDQQVRNGYVAMSDIQRLILVTQKASLAGEASDQFRADFASATDFLFARTDHFKNITTPQSSLRSKQEAVIRLEEIVALADAAAAADFPDLAKLTEDFVVLASEARGHLVQFLDEMRRKADRIRKQQSAVVRKQQILVLATLTGLTLVGSVALIFLRREVLGRRARERAELRVEFLAFFDHLTSLPNRVQFQERLQGQLDRHLPLTLIYIDLDGFKIINDTNGHAAGDAVLRRVGAILSRIAIDHKGFAARLGGDEFAMVIPHECQPDLVELCERILHEASEAFEFEGETFTPSLSIGLASTTNVDNSLSESLDGLSRVTDFALYVSKAEGRSKYTIYDGALEQRFLERRAMLEELPNAIAEHQLQVFLQPKVNLADGVPFGYEALVRWQRGDRLVQPAEFIQLAEESGLVLDIDRYMLTRATAEIAAHNAATDGQLSVSVNLSALHFNSDRIVQWVDEALAASRIRPELLTLEITETVEMLDWKQAQQVIARLKALGCTIAIDDFGAGYSSLAYLRSTTADELKIDRSLIEELETSEKARLLLASVFDIARNLKIDVTVEGIETQRQVEILQGMGAKRGQGYFFGKPEPTHVALARVKAAIGPIPLRRIG